MTREAGHFLPPVGNQRNVPAEAEEGKHLEALLAMPSSTVQTRPLLEYALAYVERFQGHVLPLEHEWEWLAAALQRAWQEEQYEAVARLASALAYPAGRRRNVAEARRLLQMGIVACRRARDRQHFALLLNRLGGLVFTHGQYRLGYRLWHTGLYALDSVGNVPGLWEPLSSFAHIADLLGNYASAQHFLETFYNRPRSEEEDGRAVALFVRGLYARFMGNLEQASADFHQCLRLLLSGMPGTPLTPARQLFLVVVQTELARAQGQFTRAQHYTATALDLARTFGDHYLFAALLVDQGVFAWKQGWYDEVRRIFPHLQELEQQAAFPNIAEVNRLLAQQLQQHILPQSPLALPPVFSPAGDPLSEREKEVLLLVADGFSNREIAARLVITTATVKKHLEHIYIRLDVHSRTAALAQARRLNLLS